MKQVAKALDRDEKAAAEFAKAVMNKLDKNADGVITLQEFVEVCFVLRIECDCKNNQKVFPIVVMNDT
jgi:Ca2+-binding EF-hand superfamily protein